MSLMTVTTGAPDIADGDYSVTLVSISEPKPIITADGSETTIRDWLWAIDEGPLEGKELPESTSMAMGPKSKAYKWLSVLLGRKLAVGESVDPTSLYGRRAMATIAANEKGWPRIEYLRVMPAPMLAQGIAQATGAPLRAEPAAVAPAAEPAPTPDRLPDNMPF